MTNLTLSIIQVAYAHEEGATSVTLDNITGPILALIIIVLAVVVAKRIKKENHKKGGESNYEQRN